MPLFDSLQSIILPFSICIYGANPVVVHHALLGFWGCDPLDILYLHHIFLKHTQTHWCINIKCVPVQSQFVHPPNNSFSWQNRTLEWFSAMNVRGRRHIPSVRLILPLICPLCPCEWTATFAGTGPWPGSRTPLCCEMLWKQKTTCYSLNISPIFVIDIV